MEVENDGEDAFLVFVFVGVKRTLTVGQEDPSVLA